MQFIYGLLFGICGQILSFLQLQCSVKWGWWDKFPILILLSAVPGLWLYTKSVEMFIAHFGGIIWPGRLIGFAIGMMVFMIMSTTLFSEPFTPKVMVSLSLALAIVLIQIYW